MAGGSSNGLRGIALQATVPWLCSTALALSSALAPAAAPVFDGFFPAGGKQGSSFTLLASGKLDPDVRIWTDCPGRSLLPTAL